ncbi:hypothetical protein L5G32_17035 [Gordonia sp. HY002]|uniref:hypothetical protein n=1 Tax=Gordonia zhenghanii TaxID=2911516 RepID=UPI001EF1165C|nr:hypothetical protein [Gordonia zhenghanii]MCF8571975.1 hypothetical protein [Gordonia zhenghanii]MCF8604193.1 hypothetical protein [Gordonia zhenghanii]
MTADSGPADAVEVGSVAEQIADAVLALPGVIDLHSGLFGEVATYMPGQRVSGIALRDEDGEVHIVADLTYDLQEVAAAVRDTAESITGLEFSVVVEDIAQTRKAG